MRDLDFSPMGFGQVKDRSNMTIHGSGRVWVAVKAGLWTLDWTMDWTVDWMVDWILYRINLGRALDR